MSKIKNLFLFFSLFLFAGLSLNSYAGPVTLPNYIGGTEADAKADIASTDGLNFGGSTRQNDSAPKDEVIDQSPAAGVVDFDTTVTLVVSDGPTTTSTSGTTSSTSGTTSSTSGTTSSTSGTTSSTSGTTSSTIATTTTTMGGGSTTPTTATPTTTTTPATTTTTLPPVRSDDDTFDFGGGGCTISNTRSASMDPIWLLLLLAPGLGLLRRHRVATASARRTGS